MKSLHLFCTLFFLCTQSLSAQAPPYTAKFTAKDIQQQGLMVWLPDEKKRIAWLEEHGMQQEAQAEKDRIVRENRELVDFYKAHYHFSKVYFFYSSDEEDLKNRLPVLLDETLHPDPSIPLPDKIIVGGFFMKRGQESYPFPSRQFRVENSTISMNLRKEKIRLLPFARRSYKKDIIRLDRKLHRMLE